MSHYTLPLFFFSCLLHRVVIIFIIIKIFFYVCWYRSRQRQLAAYLSNPRNAQIVIVGGRAYLHQMCERQSVSADPPPASNYYFVIQLSGTRVVFREMSLLWLGLSIHQVQGFGQ